MVSIIVPIYNPGDRLFICLDSIKRQIYNDIEVIMVNDGSTDNSSVICKNFASKDSRFVYIEQENSGVSVARNNGIAFSHGEYICFVDSDDSVEPDYISCMLDARLKTGADLVLQGLVNIYEKKKREEDLFPDVTLMTYDLDDNMFDKLFYSCGPYCKLFIRKYLLNNKIQFPVDLEFGEDLVFYAKYLHLCKKITFLSNASYNYNVGVSGSLSSKILNPDKFWKDQVNRRLEYILLRKQFRIEKDFYPTENAIKLISLKGLLKSIKHYGLDINKYVSIIRNDEVFEIEKIRPSSLKDKLLISLILSQNPFSRILLNVLLFLI